MPDYEKFYILNGQKMFMLYDDGERITFDAVPGFAGLPFYVHRYINDGGDMSWAVTCPRTGQRLGQGDTRDKAIGKAGLILSMQGREAYDFNVKRLNKKYGVPPAVPVDPVDKVDELYRYLKGEGLPEGVECQTPKLSPEMAFHVIRFLQEITNCLPDYIERCNGCGELYDSERSGYYLDDQYADKKTGKTLAKKYWGSWCDGCVPNVEFYVKERKANDYQSETDK